MASSLLVVLPIADTTTTGFRSTRALTIPATRSMAMADSTEVPPNFMTIMGGRSVQHPFRMHQLRIQHRGSRCAANGVVAQRDKFIVEYRAGAQAPDECRHPSIALDIFARLRPVGLGHILHGTARRARKVAILGHA